MTVQIAVIFVLMIAAYAVAKGLKLSVDLSILAAAVTGGIVGAFVKTPRLGELPVSGRVHRPDL